MERRLRQAPSLGLDHGGPIDNLQRRVLELEISLGFRFTPPVFILCIPTP